MGGFVINGHVRSHTYWMSSRFIACMTKEENHINENCVFLRIVVQPLCTQKSTIIVSLDWNRDRLGDKKSITHLADVPILMSRSSSPLKTGNSWKCPFTQSMIEAGHHWGWWSVWAFSGCYDGTRKWRSAVIWSPSEPQQREISEVSKAYFFIFLTQPALIKNKTKKQQPCQTAPLGL